MDDLNRKTCQRNCWWIAAIAGALFAVLLCFMAKTPLGASIFLGLILFVFLGPFLTWAFCSGAGNVSVAPQTASTQTRVVESVTARPEPAPAPAPMPVAEPVAAAAPQPAEVVTAPVTPAAPVMAPTPKPKAKSAAKPKAPAKAKAADKPAAKVAAKAPKASGLDVAMDRNKERPTGEPELLLAPRGGKADDLKLIVGVGPALEKLLNSVGVWHFDQIASWKAKDIAFVDGKMANFKGRITRDEWVKQARALAKGASPEAKSKA